VRRLGAALVAVWLVGGAMTILHAERASAFAVRSAASAPVFETFAAAGALLLATLFYGRFRQRQLMPDLLGCVAFAMVGLGNVAFGVLPLLATPHLHWRDMHSVALLTGFAAAVTFAFAAMARPVQVRRAHGWLVVTALLLAAGAIALLALRLGAHFDLFTSASSSEASTATDNAAVTVVQTASALAFALASLRFFLAGKRGGDLFCGWLAVAAACWALARANFAVTPAHYSGSITLGDWFRVSAYAIAVLAAGAELTAYWRGLAQKAVLEERRRIARDLHDGLAQELAFIINQSKQVAAGPTADGAMLLSRAAQRALDESRRAMAALTAPIGEPLEVALGREIEELCARLGVRVVPDLAPVGKVTPETRETVLRIAREAITNAARHGQPTRINVLLANHDGITLRVVDNGRGFRPEAFTNGAAAGHYGIVGMRERAEAMGGEVAISSRLFAGSTVEVWVP
jgi:signal transduction histidine kinase